MSCKKEKLNAVSRKLPESVLLKRAPQQNEGQESQHEGSRREGKHKLTAKHQANVAYVFYHVPQRVMVRTTQAAGPNDLGQP